MREIERWGDHQKALTGLVTEAISRQTADITLIWYLCLLCGRALSRSDNLSGEAGESGRGRAHNTRPRVLNTAPSDRTGYDATQSCQYPLLVSHYNG